MQTIPGNRSSMNASMNDFASRPTVLRKALEFHQPWIETTLGVGLADVVIFEVDLNLAQIGLETLPGCFQGEGAEPFGERFSVACSAASTSRSSSGVSLVATVLRILSCSSWPAVQGGQEIAPYGCFR